MIGWHADTEDSANFYEFLTDCPNADTGAGQYNAGNYCNPEIDELVAYANLETDCDKRAEMLQEVEQASTTMPPSCRCTGRIWPGPPRRT